ncbi:MAG: hypothetical protein V4723_19315 [Pseudomonadota bacterium]
MRDHSHYSPDNTGICAHCGQPLPDQQVTSYGDKRVRPIGLIVTVLLHLLLVGLYFIEQQIEKKAPPPSGGDITYINPLPKKPEPKIEPKRAPSKPVKQTKPTVAKVQRLPDTITLPNEKPAEAVPEPEPVKAKIDPAEDMMAKIEERRRARGQSEQPAEETEAQRGNRVALANIAAANGKSKGDDSSDSGGVFSVINQTFNRADVKFRGWNPKFQRRWLTQVTVERGNYPDIETAIVMKMIELIRKEKTGNFEWDSHRLQRVVTKSARVEDTEELKEFLFKEMFANYQAPRGR